MGAYEVIALVPSCADAIADHRKWLKHYVTRGYPAHRVIHLFEFNLYLGQCLPRLANAFVSLNRAVTCNDCSALGTQRARGNSVAEILGEL